MNNEDNQKEAQKLIDKVKNIPGEKLITLFSCEGEEKVLPLNFIVDELGNFESLKLYSICISKISELINTGGVLLVCDFLYDREIIYGFVLSNNSWTSLPAEEMEAVYYTLYLDNPDMVRPNVGFCNL